MSGRPADRPPTAAATRRMALGGWVNAPLPSRHETPDLALDGDARTERVGCEGGRYRGPPVRTVCVRGAKRREGAGGEGNLRGAREPSEAREPHAEACLRALCFYEP